MTGTKTFFRTHEGYKEYCSLCGKFEVDENVACEEDETSFGGDTLEWRMREEQKIIVNEFPAYGVPPEHFEGKSVSHEFEEGQSIC